MEVEEVVATMVEVVAGETTVVVAEGTLLEEGVVATLGAVEVVEAEVAAETLVVAVSLTNALPSLLSHS